AQWAPAPYIGLWSRLARFTIALLERALAQRRVVKATLMRGTLHLVSAKDYLAFSMATSRAPPERWDLARRRHVDAATILRASLRSTRRWRPRTSDTSRRAARRQPTTSPRGARSVRRPSAPRSRRSARRSVRSPILTGARSTT